MPVFHEGVPISRDVVEGFSVSQEQATEFALNYSQATEEQKIELLSTLTLPLIPDISQCLTNPFYRATCGIDSDLYEKDTPYRERVNELIRAQLSLS